MREKQKDAFSSHPKGRWLISEAMDAGSLQGWEWKSGPAIAYLAQKGLRPGTIFMKSHEPEKTAVQSVERLPLFCCQARGPLLALAALFSRRHFLSLIAESSGGGSERYFAGFHEYTTNIKSNAETHHHPMKSSKGCPRRVKLAQQLYRRCLLHLGWRRRKIPRWWQEQRMPGLRGSATDSHREIGGDNRRGGSSQ